MTFFVFIWGYANVIASRIKTFLYPLLDQFENEMKILSISIAIFVCAVSIVAAEMSVKIERPIQSIEGGPIDIEFLRNKIRNIDDHLEDSELSNLIKISICIQTNFAASA